MFLFSSSLDASVWFYIHHGSTSQPMGISCRFTPHFKSNPLIRLWWYDDVPGVESHLKFKHKKYSDIYNLLDKNIYIYICGHVQETTFKACIWHCDNRSIYQQLEGTRDVWKFGDWSHISPKNWCPSSKKKVILSMNSKFFSKIICQNNTSQYRILRNWLQNCLHPPKTLGVFTPQKNILLDPLCHWQPSKTPKSLH